MEDRTESLDSNPLGIEDMIIDDSTPPWEDETTDPTAELVEIEDETEPIPSPSATSSSPESEPISSSQKTEPTPEQSLEATITPEPTPITPAPVPEPRPVTFEPAPATTSTTPVEQVALFTTEAESTAEQASRKQSKVDQQAERIAQAVQSQLDSTLTRALTHLQTQSQKMLQDVNAQATASLQHVATELGTVREAIRTEMETTSEMISTTLNKRIENFEERQQQVFASTDMMLEDVKRGLTETAKQLIDTRLQTLDSFTNATKDAQKRHESTLERAQRNEQTLDRAAKTLSMRIWAGALGMALGFTAILVLGLSVLRPGWTLSKEQHEALWIGTQTVRLYQQAAAKEKVQICETLRWRDCDRITSSSKVSP